MSAASPYTNALATESSPYLLQHAHNPVDWHPWNAVALQKARTEHKPIFLSVGYSSCHWCHVMERESFENEEIARFLNQHFVAIKVDREERPDIDEIYMTAVQLVSQQGGWPMSVFLTPEALPFFGGTYFPPEDRNGHLGFKSLLRRIHELWSGQREQVLEEAGALADAVREYLAQKREPGVRQLFTRRENGVAPTKAVEDMLRNAIAALHESFDPLHGGFGARPKFPPHNALPLLLQLQRRRPNDDRLLRMVTLTLDQMARGGICDHLAGGFHRYSTDERWLVPHFEKMLYDNALLARSYAEAAKTYGEGEYARVARATYDWVLRDMTSPEGGFYSALDADSPGGEGRFYVWSKAEIDRVLGPDAPLFCEAFNVQAAGNFHDEASRAATGMNILHLSEALAQRAARLDVDEAALRAQLDARKARLLAERANRPRPGLDDKVLTAWNALMVSSLACGSLWLKDERYQGAAVRAAEFLLKNLRTPAGRWLASWRQGQAKLPAYLDDHAFLAVAFLDLFEATGQERWKNETVQVVQTMELHFSDAQDGGYFFTADDHEKLFVRPKDPLDKATPSGNGWAALALVRLHKLTGDPRYLDQAAKLLETFQPLIERAPQATESLLLALAWLAPERAATPAPTATTLEHHAVANQGPVIAELRLDQPTVRAGETARLTVRLTVDRGWHIQAPPHPAAPRISLADDELGTLENIEFPEPQKLSSAELGPLSVYSGTVTISATLKLRPDAPRGRRVLGVKVQFQACNDRVCDKPASVSLSVPIEVA